MIWHSAVERAAHFDPRYRGSVGRISSFLTGSRRDVGCTGASIPFKIGLSIMPAVALRRLVSYIVWLNSNERS